MRPFEYIRPRSLDEASTVLAGRGADARILAGGTDLLIELRRGGTRQPGAVLDISFLDDLHGIVSVSDSFILKPLLTHSEIMRSGALREAAPLLSRAASVIGSPQIRNRGTLGGNIMNAAACADTVPPLIALGATLTLRSKKGQRKLDLSEFFLEPYKTKASPDEILTEISFRKLPREAQSSFVKLGRRSALSISRLSVAVILIRDKNGKITDARVVPGAAFPVWRRVTEAEALLIGERPSSALFAEAGRKVSETMIAETGRRWSSEYKKPVIAVLVRRALEECVEIE